ncbi:MAG: hypothetical protein K2M92_01805, partial [Bacteroidales bacterium]|nr:hypothetical protein [Bacteroidales bacterium]
YRLQRYEKSSAEPTKSLLSNWLGRDEVSSTKLKVQKVEIKDNREKKRGGTTCSPFFLSSLPKLFGGNFGGNFSGFYHFGFGYNAFAFFYYFNGFFVGNAGFGSLVAFATYESERNQSAQKNDLFHGGLFL